MGNSINARRKDAGDKKKAKSKKQKELGGLQRLYSVWAYTNNIKEAKSKQWDALAFH